jgi:hypothetical protein
MITRAIMSTALITSLVKELANITQNFSLTAVSAGQIPGQWSLPSPNSTCYPINSQSFVQWIMTTAIRMHDSHWRMEWNTLETAPGTLISGWQNPKFSQWLKNKYVFSWGIEHIALYYMVAVYDSQDSLPLPQQLVSDPHSDTVKHTLNPATLFVTTECNIKLPSTSRSSM